MAIIAPLITTEYMFKWTTIDNNIDVSLINPNIIIAGDVHIQDILGEQLYFKIMADVIAGSIGGNYQYLLNTYIQPALAQYTHYEIMFDLRTRDTNKGILEKTTDSKVSTPSKDSEFYAKVNHIKSRADRYNQRVREYIINNPNMFPEYFTQIGIERITPRRTTYFSGVAYQSKTIMGDRKCCGGPTGFQINP